MKFDNIDNISEDKILELYDEAINSNFDEQISFTICCYSSDCNSGTKSNWVMGFTASCDYSQKIVTITELSNCYSENYCNTFTTLSPAKTYPLRTDGCGHTDICRAIGYPYGW